MTGQEVRYATERHNAETRPHNPMSFQETQGGTIPSQATTQEARNKEDQQISGHGERHHDLFSSAPTDGHQ